MDAELLLELIQGLSALTWRHLVMIAAGGLLIYLAIAKDYEPVLLIPIGFGAILANLPLTGVLDPDGLLGLLYRAGVETELFPLLIFIGVGAMTDFGPLLENPRMALLGAAGQVGIFATLLLAISLGFDLNEAASIGIIGAIDGPTAIYVSSQLAPHLLGPIAVAAYSYMSLVPVIQPPVMRLLTTERERKVRMDYVGRPIAPAARILFPILVTIIISLLAPAASPLIGALMFGNLLRESGVVESLARSARTEIVSVSTIFLGLAIGGTMTGAAFLQMDTLLILALGLLAFVVDTAGGLLLGKLLFVLSRGNFNPLIGAAGISAFPMSARIVQRFGQEYDFENFLLMHAMGANTAGQLGSVVAGGVVLALVGGLG